MCCSSSVLSRPSEKEKRTTYKSATFNALTGVLMMNRSSEVSQIFEQLFPPRAFPGSHFAMLLTRTSSTTYLLLGTSGRHIVTGHVGSSSGVWRAGISALSKHRIALGDCSSMREYDDKLTPAFLAPSDSRSNEPCGVLIVELRELGSTSSPRLYSHAPAAQPYAVRTGRERICPCLPTA